MSAHNSRNRLDSELLRQRLILRHAASERKLLSAHATAREFFEKLQLRPGKIREHAARLVTSGALAGSLLLSSPLAITSLSTLPTNSGEQSNLTPAPILSQNMSQFLTATLPPVGNWTLNSDQEEKIKKKIRDTYGVNATPELDGNRLPNDYGRMGAEQLLPRYPGDSAYDHGEFIDKGQTPGLGGWGYFAYSKDKMTEELYQTEKYYVAVPIIYLPDFRERVKYYVDWYKYRRMVVVNPANGKAIVTAVADAGPANWTGKHFGGSPAVMSYLGINTGMQNHPVVMYFLDDPNKEVPLGPLEYNWTENQKLLAYRD